MRKGCFFVFYIEQMYENVRFFGRIRKNREKKIDFL